MILTISTPDDFYFNQLLVFLTTLRNNSPNSKATICLVNYPVKTQIRLKRKFGCNENIIFESRKVNINDERGSSLIILRLQLIKEFLEVYKKPVAWIDTDIIIRGSLDSFLSIKPNQFKILYRGDNVPDRLKFNGGVLNLGYSKETVSFINECYNNSLKNPVWGIDQTELWNSYKRSKNIELVKISKSYNDLGDSTNENSFSSDSIIWHCKKSHFNNPRFQKEFQQYLKLGKRLFYGFGELDEL